MRKYTLGDTLLGMLRSLFNGTGMNHGATMRQINAAHDERKRRERNTQFGQGTVGGDERNWESPFHATMQSGRPVTVSFGKGSRKGDLLICDGHVNFDTFYGNPKLRIEKGHDHFKFDGTPARERGKYRG